MSVSSEEWKTSTKKETLGALEQELAKLLNTSRQEDLEKNRKELSGFRNLFARFLRAKTHVDWSKIEPLPEGSIRGYKYLEHPNNDEVISSMLNKLVVVKLNGGLGTSMGCKGPKSVIPVRNELTFLDLTLQQIQTLNKAYGVDVPLVLMNSFNTEEDTKKVLKKYANVKVSVHTFCQSQYPRINRETLMPIAKSLNDSDNECWYPPGHGNFYEAFYNSGLLDKFIEDGKEYCFLSNIDNMGATVDFAILNFLLSPPAGHEHPEFLMEVTNKTRADVKGGTLIQYENRLMLLEIAQVPKDYVDEFKSISKFRIFNTNNLWAKLSAIKRVVENNELEMEVIVNPKHLDRGLDIIQLETAAGAAVKNFKGACGINVPRSRFLPVKKCSDLLLLMSNLYDIDHGSLTLSEQRSFPTTPLVKLGSSFDKVSDFLKRFQGIPDLLELDHLTVSGDVWFGKDVSLKKAMQDGEKLDVPLPAPRNAQTAKPPDRKTMISPPFNFRHVSHVGTDFKSEDVRRAIRPVSKLEEIDNLPQAPSLESECGSDGYEKVSPRSSEAGGAEQVTLSPSAHYENIPAFKVGGNSVEGISSNVAVSQHRKQSMAETPWYENVASTQSNIESSQRNHEDTTDNHEAEMRARLSKKKLPAPPPPPVGLRGSADKDSRTVETPVLWRPQFPNSPPNSQSEITIKTPDKIEQHCTSSVVLERPNILGADAKIGLDDAIPLPTSVRDPRDCNPLTTSDAKPILDRCSTPVPKPRTAHWMTELPEEERNRISTLWVEATGESEVPDDRCRVKETVAMYEGRLKKGPPPRPPPPSRRRAPPPPTETNGFPLVHQTACDHPEGTAAAEDGNQSCAPTMNGNEQSASGEEHVEANATLPQGPEEKRLGKPEKAVDVNSLTPVDVLAECLTQCAVTLKKKGAVGETTYVNVDRAGSKVLEKVRATFTVCDAEAGLGSRKGSRGDVEEDRVDSGADSVADVEITRF